MAVVCLAVLLLSGAWTQGRAQGPMPWFYNVSTNLFSCPGDVTIGGLFPINQLTSNLSQRLEPDDISCDSINAYGLGLALVMKYSIDEINGNKRLLPGIVVGYEIFDECSQAAVIVTPTMHFLTKSESGALPVQCNYTEYAPRVVAVIGPESSESTAVIAKLLSFFLMPQIGYAATSNQFSDKTQYPSFLRTVPSDSQLVEAMVQLLLAFDWNWVAVVGSDEAYGRGGLQQLTTVASTQSICLAYEGLIPMYGSPDAAIATLLNNIQANSVQVVLIISLVEQAVQFFKQVIQRNMTGVWLLSTALAVDDRLTSLPNIHKVGTIIAFKVWTRNLELLTNFTNTLLTRLSQQRPSLVQPYTDPLLNPCPKCWSLTPANISLVTTPSVQLTAFSVYAAVQCVAKALHSLLGCSATRCPGGAGRRNIHPWQVLEKLTTMSLDVNGTNIVFDKNGNPNIGYVVIQWFWVHHVLNYITVGNFTEELFINTNLFKWHTEDSTAPSSNCSAKCSAGQVHRVKGFHSCCYDCIDCRPGSFQGPEATTECQACPPGQWSALRSTSCSTPIFTYLSWDQPDTQGLLLGVLTLLGLQGAAGALLWRHRGTPVVHALGGTLGGLALLGLMGATASLLLFLGPPGDLVCRLQLPLCTTFATVTLATMLAVSLQIFYVTEFPQQAAAHLPRLSAPGAWLVLLACSLLQAGLCGWFLQQSPSLSQYVAELHVTFLSSFLACPVEPLLGLALMQGVNVGLALLCFMLTFMAARPPHQYNLVRDVTFSSLGYCVAWVVFIPIYTGLSDRQRAVIYVGFSLAGGLALLAGYVLPKCLLLLRAPQLNTHLQFHTFLEGAPPRPEEEAEASPPPRAETPAD